MACPNSREPEYLKGTTLISLPKKDIISIKIKGMSCLFTAKPATKGECVYTRALKLGYYIYP